MLGTFISLVHSVQTDPMQMPNQQSRREAFSATESLKLQPILGGHATLSRSKNHRPARARAFAGGPEPRARERQALEKKSPKKRCRRIYLAVSWGPFPLNSFPDQHVRTTCICRKNLPWLLRYSWPDGALNQARIEIDDERHHGIISGTD